jgi:hypothetical protein
MWFAVKFQSLSSSADILFWKELADRKIDVYKLSDEARVRLLCAEPLAS